MVWIGVFTIVCWGLSLLFADEYLAYRKRISVPFPSRSSVRSPF